VLKNLTSIGLNQYRMKQCLYIICILLPCTIFCQVDSDLDGMPDDWEIANGLDPSDPKDAFDDPDCDQVWNLYEFQLGSDILDVESPQSILVNPMTSTNELQELISQTDDSEGLLIRLQEGIYESLVFDLDEYEDYSNRMMIQGGWNCIMQYNPINNRTILKNQPDLFHPFQSRMIYDGLEFDNTRLLYFSWYVDDGIFSISNCAFYNDLSDPPASPVFIAAGTNKVDVYMTNTSVVQQSEEIFFLTGGSTAKIKAQLLRRWD